MGSFKLVLFLVGCCLGKTVPDEDHFWEIEEHRELFLGLEMGLHRDNYSCPDFTLGSLCDTECRVDYIGCRQDCSELACENECVIVYGDCLSDCPCGVNCEEGCENCPHPLCEKSPCEDLDNNKDFQRCKTINQNELNKCIDSCIGTSIDCYEDCSNLFVDKMKTCPCFEGCIQGCPFCPEFECEPDDTFTAIFLTADTSVFNSEILSLDGEYKERAIYTMDSTYHSINAIYEGIVYLFGGTNSKSIQKVDGCSLVTLSTQLTYSVNADDANTAIDEQGVFTCFSGDMSWVKCQIFDGSSVSVSPHNALRDKGRSCMATYDGKPVAMGGDGGKYVEVLYDDGWFDIGMHPADTRHAGCLTIDNARKIVTIGGDDSGVVYAYVDSEWVYLGDLKLSHYNNQVLPINGFIISAVGNDGSYNGIERIQISDNGFTSEIIYQQTREYDVYRPILLPTTRNQCLA